MFATLPVEMQRACINYLDAVSLKAMRLTSRDIRDIATEALFEVATLRLEPESAQKFTSLIENDRLRRYIRKLHLDTQCDSESTFEECYIVPPPNWWTQIFAASIDLPNLKELMLDSASACAESHCAALALAFTTFFSTADIDLLNLKHHQDACLVQRPDLLKLHAKPKKLHFLMTTWSDDASPDMDIELRHRHALFNVHLDTTWLGPLQPHLTHLTVHCNTYWGVYPRWQPGPLRFPHLKSLALGKWTIAFNWQIEFIALQGQTLEQLILTNCPILHALRMTKRQSANQWQQRLPGTSRGKPPTDNVFPDLRWHTVLPDLKVRLPKLKYFAMGRGPVRERLFNREVSDDDEAYEERYKLKPRIDSSRYAIFDFEAGLSEWVDAGPDRDSSLHQKGGWECSHWLDRSNDEEWRTKTTYPDCLQEDQEALTGFLEELSQR
ncbi:hypothetical protein N0V95_008998 [Ascochyta clinopodiicola]|nr:hypothetical protein N0V95_008998 [Ascochyta clinopodiicola]